MMGAGFAGENDETSSARSGNMADDGENGANPRFASHWLTIQPHLFPEWEREMDRRDVEEEVRRQAESDRLREAKRVSRASAPTAPPR